MINRLQVTAIFTDYYPINDLLEELDRRKKDMVVIKPYELDQEACSISVDQCNQEAASPESCIQFYRCDNSPDTPQRKCNFTSHRLHSLYNAVRSLIKGVSVLKYYANQYLCSLHLLTQAWDNGIERGWKCQKTKRLRSSKPGACRVAVWSGSFLRKAVNSAVLAASYEISILTNPSYHRLKKMTERRPTWYLCNVKNVAWS